jgi:4-hydroxy-2-oxoheptanedioate aldolase
MLQVPTYGYTRRESAFPCFEFGLKTPSANVAEANDSILTMAQIESVEGLNNINEICQVDGISM